MSLISHDNLLLGTTSSGVLTGFKAENILLIEASGRVGGVVCMLKP
ncbi:hypothetical protein BSPA111_24540 [Buttiauxella sp. A111]|nr:hypothetical protein BSPA111_24540 [Buttiauxella sp. A111]